MQVAQSSPTRTARRPWWTSTALMLALLATLLLLAPLAYQARHRGVILPGIRVAGVPIGGLTPVAAVERLRQSGLDPEATLSVRVGGDVIELPAAATGVALDMRATVEDAYRMGRGRAALLSFPAAIRARAVGIDSPVRVAFDRGAAESALAQLALRTDRPAQDAALRLDGVTPVAVQAEAGTRLDQPAAAEALEAAARLGRWPVPEIFLPVDEVAPTVTDTVGATDRARALLSGPIKLRGAEDSWELAPPELGPMLTSTVRDGTLALDLDRQRLAAWLAPITEAISQTARNPRFHFDAETRRLVLFETGRTGRRIDLDATAQRILEAADDPRRMAQISTSLVPPVVPESATAEDLGIREVVHEETSRYVGSPPERIHNIGVAAKQFDGLLIPPDAVFSFNEHLGDVSPENGYQKTKIIMDGATRDGVGGGVCQVSTTLFRAAFWAGLPIVERLAHGYRVAYYEQGAPAGLDATVFQPSPDLRFRNDTGSWLLVETSSDPRKATVTFRLLGTRPPRDVRMEGPTISDVVPPPPPRVEVDASLPPGATTKVELERSGATVSLTRVISEDGREVRDVFASRYRPTGAITAISPADAQEAPPATTVTPAPPTPGAP